MAQEKYLPLDDPNRPGGQVVPTPRLPEVADVPEFELVGLTEPPVQEEPQWGEPAAGEDIPPAGEPVQAPAKPAPPNRPILQSTVQSTVQSVESTVLSPARPSANPTDTHGPSRPADQATPAEPVGRPRTSPTADRPMDRPASATAQTAPMAPPVDPPKPPGPEQFARPGDPGTHFGGFAAEMVEVNHSIPSGAQAKNPVSRPADGVSGGNESVKAPSGAQTVAPTVARPSAPTPENATSDAVTPLLQPSIVAPTVARPSGPKAFDLFDGVVARPKSADAAKPKVAPPPLPPEVEIQIQGPDGKVMPAFEDPRRPKARVHEATPVDAPPDAPVVDAAIDRPEHEQASPPPMNRPAGHATASPDATLPKRTTQQQADEPRQASRDAGGSNREMLDRLTRIEQSNRQTQMLLLQLLAKGEESTGGRVTSD